MREALNFEAPKVEAEIPLHFRDVKEFIKINPDAQQAANDTRRALELSHKREFEECAEVLRDKKKIYG